MTSNRSVSEWGDVFGDNVVATAIWDRLLHHSTVATLVLFKGARLAGRIRAGEFKRLRPPEALGEGRRLLSLLEIPTVYDGTHKTNAYSAQGAFVGAQGAFAASDGPGHREPETQRRAEP